jgi:hypothetical protein
VSGLPRRRSPATYAAVAVASTLAAGALSGLAGAALPLARFDASGRPDALAVATGFVIGFAVNVTLLHLLLPEVAAWAASEGTSASGAARAEAFRWSRWPGLAALVGLTALVIGGALERQAFGEGQALMLAGAGVFSVSILSWDVLEAVGAWRGVTAARAPAP